MDSLTHVTLGACIGEVMLGKRMGKRVLLLGAVADTKQGYYVGRRSVFDSLDRLTGFAFFPRHDSLLEADRDAADMKQLLRFADEHYIV